MTNKNLLQEAIAEAKTIREAAIANAKEALGETLTPHLKEMLSLKLQEMDEEDDLDEERLNGTSTADGISAGDHGNEIGVNSPINEDEDEEAESEEEEEEEENPEEEKEEEEEEDLDPNDPDFGDKLKDLIRDIIAQESGEEGEESEEGEEFPKPEAGLEGSEDSNQIDIDELLAELAEGEMAYNKPKSYVEPGINNPYGTKGKKDTYKTKGDGYTTGVDEEDLDENMIGELPHYIQTVKDALDTLDSDQLSGVIGGAGAAALVALGKALEKTGLLDKISKKVGSLGVNKPSDLGGPSGPNEDLQEALKAVKTLRTQLQEVNLLNAKLLYVNKVFKSNNLTESQKVDVISTFDKAETVREVKLVFETVSKNVVTKRPIAIKEHLSFASKPTGNASTTAAPKEIISEVSDQVKRMQFLAGIKTN